MKNISLKLQENILKDTNYLLEHFKTSRNKYINDAISFYNQHQKRILIKEQLIRESKLVAKDSMEVLKEFEAIDHA